MYRVPLWRFIELATLRHRLNLTTRARKAVEGELLRFPDPLRQHAAPGISPTGILNLGADGAFVVPAGFDHDFGPPPLFTVDPDLPRGGYEFGSRLLHPVTGAALSEDLNPFEIQ